MSHATTWVPSCWLANAPSLRFVVHGPPVPWQRARVGRGGKHVTERKTRAYEALIAVHAQAVVAKARWQCAPVPATYAVAIAVYWKDALQRDCDNCAKVALDPLRGIAFVDDSQVKTLHVEQYVDRQHPRMEVVVTRLADRDDRKRKKAAKAAEETR
jgi:Holliday junction resolvase RusA-like endonuclease